MALVDGKLRRPTLTSSGIFISLAESRTTIGKHEILQRTSL